MNKQKVETMITELSTEYRLGNYDNRLNSLSASQLRRLKDGIWYGGSNDVKFRVDGKQVVVEISFVDDEVDLNMIDLDDYQELYN